MLYSNNKDESQDVLLVKSTFHDKTSTVSFERTVLRLLILYLNIFLFLIYNILISIFYLVQNKYFIKEQRSKE